MSATNQLVRDLMIDPQYAHEQSTPTAAAAEPTPKTLGMASKKEKVCMFMYRDMCNEMCTDTCLDTCVDMRLDMCTRLLCSWMRDYGNSM